MKSDRPRRADQSGIMLLEAMIAILIFSLGILTLIALQATSIKLTGDAKYRTDATLLANRLIGQMWVTGGDLAALETKFKTGGSAYNDWLDDPDPENKSGVRATLPGVVPADTDVVATLPQVVVVLTPPAAPTSAQVTITLFWRTPEMNANAPGHRHIVTTQIAKNL